ncbi:MAG TPA: methyltransferase domain-containing protein [Flavobacteriales bacterium]|nr:methyltransferase domain-containing protein [Flavobacteriales bacterium]
MSGLLHRFLPVPWRNALRNRALHGDTVHCPICGKGAIAYLPSGSPPRPHVLCPFCGSRERARMAWLFLKERGALRSGLRILHVAPESCLRDKLRSLPQVEYIAGDKHEPGYAYPPGTMDLDVTELPFPDGRFDLILCSHVLEHVPDDRTAMRELYRVLAPGGLGILMVPIALGNAVTEEDPGITDPQERLRRYGQFDHVRLYGRDYVDRLAHAGFIVTEDAMTERLSPEDVFRFGLLRSEVVHAVTK